jgi:dGTPase
MLRDPMDYDAFLATYASRVSCSKGRRYPETDHPFRSAFQRDRDRIIHSKAFRRLEYKTQVFVNFEGDHYRTRLTHTLEASQIGRTMARALRLNEDLVEAIVLGHDLGHPPFGHAGERILNELMAEQGGFDHNRQSLRVVDLLEGRDPRFPGLNLTWEVREGLAKHSDDFKALWAEAGEAALQPSLEAQVADLADDIAYYCHDLDDGLRSGLISEFELMDAGLVLWEEVGGRVDRAFSNLDGESRRYMMIRALVDLLVTDVVQESARLISGSGVATPKEVRGFSRRLVAFSSELLPGVDQLAKFLWDRLYCHYRVVRANERAARIIKGLFEGFVSNARQLPHHIQRRVSDVGLERAVCDYIAGMTDRFALDEYREMVGLEFRRLP